MLGRLVVAVFVRRLVVAVLAIEEAPLDPKTSACPDTSPEPQPTECRTCCYPIAKEDLFGCRTEQCSYLQCASCILKGGGGVCRNPECNFVHWECPACTQPGGGNAQLRLTDARFSKADVLLVLKTVRKDMDKTMTDAHDEIQATMAQFAETVLSFGQDMSGSLLRHAQRLTAALPNRGREI